MGSTNGKATEVLSDEFRGAFSIIEPLIRKEWPAIDGEALLSTGGDMEQVTELVASKTERTKTLVRRQLAELYTIATDSGASEADHLDKTIQRLEARARVLAGRAKKALPQAEEMVKKNIWSSLLYAVGLGLFLGLFLRFTLRGRRGP